MAGNLIASQRAISPTPIFLGQKSYVYLRFRNTGDTDTFTMQISLRRISDGRIRICPPTVAWTIVSGEQTTYTDVFTFTPQSSDAGVWELRVYWTRHSDLHSETLIYSGNTATVYNSYPPIGQLDSVTSSSERVYMAYDEGSDINYTVKNIGPVSDTFKFYAVMRRQSDGYEERISPVTDYTETIAAGGTKSKANRFYFDTPGADKIGTYELVVYYRMLSEGYANTYGVLFETVVEVILPHGEMIVTSSSAVPSTINVGDTTNVLVNIKNDSPIADSFTIAGYFKRRSDGRNFLLTPFFPFTSLFANGTANHIYTPTATSTDEGIWDLFIYYETTTGFSETLLTTTVLIINPVTPPVCGNNLKEGTEVCDGTDLAGKTCLDFGFTGGILNCKSDCSGFDTSLCTGAEEEEKKFPILPIVLAGAGLGIIIFALTRRKKK